MNKIYIVFDMDRTIGYFEQLSIFVNLIENYLNRLITKQEFHKLIKLYPKLFRTNIFKIFDFLKKNKKHNPNLKVTIYTNNPGYNKWVEYIISYIEKKLSYKLFDKINIAYKIDNIILDKCRTTNDKVYRDLKKCYKLKKDDKLIFLDDQRHPGMVHKNIKYLYVEEYKKDILFEKMINTFLKSKLSKQMKITDKKLFMNYFNEFIKEPFYDNELYIEQPYSFYENIDILKEIKLFLKLNNHSIITRHKTKKKRKKKRRGTRKINI